ncbi:MAG: type II toxin-antitoxin system VapC family toxin [Actinobacteria bacterium]|nr:type II toxin-antitoxin system VapC family toxin [Actinomycetota bacterium]
MNLFFDTSALIKFFHEEQGTVTVTDLITNPESTIHVSDLVRIEFISALYRRYRNKEIDDKALSEATNGFYEEYSRFNVEPLGHAVLQEAEELLIKHGRNHGLRTLDALHLATCVLLKEAS